MRLFRAMSILVLTLAVFSTATSEAQDVVDDYVSRTFISPKGVSMPYRLFVPDEQVRDGLLPVIIYLHGGGGAGTENLKQIAGGNTSGTHLWTTPELQARHPAFVVAPQLPGDYQWSAPDSDELAPYAILVVELLANLSKEFVIDSDRVYLIGQSRGGRGTWDLISKRPDLFAAAVPICGDGNPSRVTSARSVSIWAFHGAKDLVIPVTGSRDLVAALKAVGSRVRYTEYPEEGHAVWTLAFADRDLPDWLFAQRLAHR